MPVGARSSCGTSVAATRTGYPLDWPATADALSALVDGVVVPGHGNHAGRPFAEDQARSFHGLADLARRVGAGEMDFEDAVQATPFESFPAEDIRRPLKRALEQLRGELDPP